MQRLEMARLRGEDFGVDAGRVRKPSGAAQLHGILQSRIAHGGLGGGLIGLRRAVKVPTTARRVLRERLFPGPGRMRIVFVHRTINDYTVETPYLRGIGGTESALCYLSIELAKRGHAVSLLTNTSAPGRYRNVECLNYKTSLTPDLINAADVVVVSNEACGRALKDEFRAKKPLVMWNQHADDQPSIEALEFTRERKAWASIAFVSEWQRDQFCNIYWVDRKKTRVMRNAISPAFAAATPGAALVQERAGAGARLHERALSRAQRAARRCSDHPLGDFRYAAARLLGIENARRRPRTIPMRSFTAAARRPKASTISARFRSPNLPPSSAMRGARLSLDVSGNVVHRSDGSDVGRRHHPDDPFRGDARDHGRIRADDRAA